MLIEETGKRTGGAMADYRGGNRLGKIRQEKKPVEGNEGRQVTYRFPFNMERVFTEPDRDVYSLVSWSKHSIKMVDHVKNKVVYEGDELEFPSNWSETACKITASKYFKRSKSYEEKSLKQLIDRIVDTITSQGDKEGYFVDEAESETFRDELKYVMLDQRACFNSPATHVAVSNFVSLVATSPR